MKDLRSRFGFHCTPFTREMKIADRFPLQVYDDALRGLIEAIDQRMSCALIAPAGTGKTALLRALVSALPIRGFQWINIHHLDVSFVTVRG